MRPIYIFTVLLIFNGTRLHAQTSLEVQLNASYNQLHASGGIFWHGSLLDFRMHVAYGNYGVQTVERDGGTIEDPYNKLKLYNGDVLEKYNSVNRSGSVAIMLGHTWQLNEKHGISAGALLQFYLASDQIHYVLMGKAYPEGLNIREGSGHNNISPGLYAEHVIRLEKRFSFYYGLNLPYFIAFKNEYYNPDPRVNVMSGLEPTLHIGFRFTAAFTQPIEPEERNPEDY